MSFSLPRTQVECYRGRYTRTVLFNIFTNYLEEVMKSTFFRFADDTKLEGTVNMLASRAAIQRALGRLEE